MNAKESALLTDLYQLTMLRGYFAERMNATAVFEFFVRKLPQERNFLIAAGLEQALDFLEGFRFADEELKWLARNPDFPHEYIDHLAELRFTGDVHAMPEGTVFFPDEPILRVTAPIAEAQIVETRLINILQFQSLIASKAARCVLAAPGKQIVDFGFRRSHGAEAGMMAARASYLAGFDGTSLVLADRLWGIPCFGTMAHSYVQAHNDEDSAFEGFARANPSRVTLLIDTYDTEAGARKVVALAPKLAAQGVRIQAVRLDSGGLADHARKVRQILDAGGLNEVKIFASGGLDEFALEKLAEAPIDGFGVGTKMNTAADAPYLDCAYKLQEYAGIARRKRSEGKATWPGRKQVYRSFDGKGHMTGDLLTTEDDEQEGTPLIVQVMANGKRLAESPPLDEIREYTLEQLGCLPENLRQLRKADPGYPVEVSTALRELATEVDAWSGRKAE